MTDKVCIIGAGPSGIAAAKIFHEQSIPFDCFEMGSGVGGLWRYNNDTDRSPAYRSLHTNTSRDKTAYSDFPMPASYPDYPHHSQMLEYLEAYVDRFGFLDAIAFRSRVERVEPIDGVEAVDVDTAESSASVGSGAPVERNAGGSYDVTVRSLNTGAAETRRYGAVVVASGHHWKPNYPSFAGEFDGIEMHSHAYRTPEIAAGKRVLIVGVGNSACDIVCELCETASKTFQSTRRGAHVIPKYLLGRPSDKWLTPLSARLPFPARSALFRLLIFLTQGRQKSYGFPIPGYRLGSEHPTISTHLLSMVRRGAITPKPDIDVLQGRSVRFVDGSEEDIDLIIYATGYVTTFPFLGFIEPRDNYLPLYLHLVHPDHPNLFFLGLVQPLGAFPPLAEAQARWVADLLTAKTALPSPAEMLRKMQKAEEMRRKRYVDSKRHRIEVDYYPYLWDVERERRIGRRRGRGVRDGSD